MSELLINKAMYYKYWNKFKRNAALHLFKMAFLKYNVQILNICRLESIFCKSMEPLTDTKLPTEAVECPQQLILSFKLHKFLTVTGVNQCRHICCMTSDLFWINDDYNDIILKNTNGDTLHKIGDRPEKEKKYRIFHNK